MDYRKYLIENDIILGIMLHKTVYARALMPYSFATTTGHAP